MTLVRGRLVKASVHADAATVVPISGVTRPVGRRLPAAVASAQDEARRVVEAAEARASEIVAKAQAEADAIRARAAEEGREDGAAALAQAWIRLHAAEDERLERELDRNLALARLMAERILGENLDLRPERILDIAREVLSQARWARRIHIHAHPDDAALLARETRALGLEQAQVEVHAAPSRSRGSLRLETDLGTLDADLAPQLDRLVAALREGLRRG